MIAWAKWNAHQEVSHLSEWSAQVAYIELLRNLAGDDNLNMLPTSVQDFDRSMSTSSGSDAVSSSTSLGHLHSKL
jgi:hypothetical protein